MKGEGKVVLCTILPTIMKHYLFFISIILLIGCQSRQYTFRPVETISNDPGSVEMVHPINAEIKFAGISKTEGDVAPVAKFMCKFTNAGGTPVKLAPNSYNLIDDEANNFRPILYNTSGAVILYPQSSTNFTLTYSFPPGYNLKKVGSFRLAWNYNVEGNQYRRLTKFVKREVEYRTRYYGYNYYPGLYSSFHFGYGHRRHFRSGIRFGFSGCY